MDYQQPDFYHFSQDSLEFTKFVLRFEDFSGPKSIVDIGAGCGVIGIEIYLWAVVKPELVFCEYQTEFLVALKNNIEAFKVNDFKIYAHCFSELKGKYDAIVCNPPYFRLGEGRLSESEQKNKARFMSEEDFQLLFKISASLSDVLFIMGRLEMKDRYLAAANENGFLIDQEEVKNNYFFLKFVLHK